MFLFQIEEAHSHHQRQGSTRLYVSVDELGQDVQPDLGICHGLDNANWQREAERDEDGQQESPPSQICGPGEDGDEAEPKHLFLVSQTHHESPCISTYNAKQGHVPPGRRLLVLSHQLHVDVRLLGRAVLVLPPNGLSVMQPCVHYQGANGCK